MELIATHSSSLEIDHLEAGSRHFSVLRDAMSELAPGHGPNHWAHLARACWTHAATLAWNEPTRDWAAVRWALGWAARLGAAVFQVASGTYGAVEVYLEPGRAPLKARSRERLNLVGAPAWEDAFFAAAIVRDQHALDVLAAHDVDALPLSVGDVVGFDRLWVRLLQSLHWPGADVSHYIGEVRRALRTFGGAAHEHDPLGASMLDLLDCLVDLDGDGFDGAMAIALARHRQRWGRSDASRGDARGFIARGPLTLACFAHDLGLPLAIDSRYVPRALFMGPDPAEDKRRLASSP